MGLLLGIPTLSDPLTLFSMSFLNRTHHLLAITIIYFNFFNVCLFSVEYISTMKFEIISFLFFFFLIFQIIPNKQNREVCSPWK